MDQWTLYAREEAIQFSRGSKLSDIELPDTSDDADLAIFSEEITVLKQSNAYPYGLSDHKIQLLRDAGYRTVGDLIDAPDDELDGVYGIGEATLLRIRNVLGQAIWM
ncbi:hypothetical protein DF050_09800 [Burkholderia cepacia]|nr:hypothetical protein DF050_09800 [Burkholderia cepacia]